jgi:hypothetical protein
MSLFTHPGAYHGGDANRHVRRCIFLVAVLAVSMLPALPVRAARCALHAGARVTLRSSDFDPDVFVWDTQTRAISYAARVTFMKVDEVLAHIVLAKPGTRATVVGCTDRVVHVRLASGPHRGRSGWVVWGDARPLR